jgi:hypothetical protein
MGHKQRSIDLGHEQRSPKCVPMCVPMCSYVCSYMGHKQRSIDLGHEQRWSSRIDTLIGLF